MKQVIASFGAGAFLGMLFSFLQLPIPAPANFAGVMGIVGVFVGYLFVKNYIHKSRGS